jgi:hypothetical protein
MLRIIVIIVVIALAHVLYIVNETLALGALVLFFTISAVIIWKMANLRYVTAGFALAGLCSFGLCGLHLYNDKSWLSVVLAVTMLMVFFGSMEIERRLHPGGKKVTSLIFDRRKSRQTISNEENKGRK